MDSAAPQGPAGWVYFIQGTSGGPVKIGFSTNPEERLMLLQVGCPVRLRLLGAFPGSMEDERSFHRELAFERAHGEWFWPSDRVLAAVRGRYGEELQGLVQHKRPQMDALLEERAMHLMASLNCAHCGRGLSEGYRLVYGVCLDCAREAVEIHEAINASENRSQAVVSASFRERREEYERRIRLRSEPPPSPAPGLLPLHEARARIRERNRKKKESA